MRGKSATCRTANLLFIRAFDAPRSKTVQSNGHVSASPRLAAHQSGRAITAVASQFDRSPHEVKYVATVSNGFPFKQCLKHTGVSSPAPSSLLSLNLHGNTRARWLPRHGNSHRWLSGDLIAGPAHLSHHSVYRSFDVS